MCRNKINDGLTNQQRYKAKLKQRGVSNNEKRRLYYKTPMGRALNLISAYNQTDRKYNLGKGDLTAKWIVENILSKSCIYCGETDYNNLGCNRINNSLPHTMDNVEPCCTKCNKKLPRDRSNTKKMG